MQNDMWKMALIWTKFILFVALSIVFVFGSVLCGTAIGYLVAAMSKNSLLGLIAGVSMYFAGMAGKRYFEKMAFPLFFNASQKLEVEKLTNTKHE